MALSRSAHFCRSILRELHRSGAGSGREDSCQFHCAVSNLANALWLDERLGDALSWARWATCQSGDSEWVHPSAWRCLGNVLLDLGCFERAAAAYQLANPDGDDPASRFNLSKAYLGLGDYAAAWNIAEARLELRPPPDGVVPGPYWQGWPHAEHVSLWSEQGLGDTLQFVRWLPALLATGRSVSLAVQAPLHALLQKGLRWLGPRLRIELDPPAPSGCHGSLLSLPWRLQQPQPPWPDGRQGYLKLPAIEVDHAARSPLIGVLWGSGRYLDGHCRERDYRRKSVLGADLMTLLQGLVQRPLDLWNLQVGADREQGRVAGVHWAGELEPDADFLALAQRLQQLDLLVCVDTAAAHLAGAMGLEAWVLLPWAAASRWQRDSSSTIWYPNLRLWRQPRHGDWQGLWPVLLEGLDQWLVMRRLNRAL